ncbi:MAG TPA: hypothetical protein VNC50_16570, partial [Planctomycetia bacterium]|nr:hypothetical protein [Planctomycetia bacterium]
LEGRYQNYESMLRDLRLAKAELERLEADPEEASVQKALAGFPPGTPRVVIVHAKTRLHDELKGKLERRGIAAVCTADLGRAVMLHEMRPFHCMILDLATTGRDGLKAYAKQKKRSYDRGLKLGGIFLAAEEAERADVDKLGLDLTLTLVGQPVTLSQLKDALDTLMPGSVRPRKDGADDDS